jgi:hypothetical protein
MSQVGACAGVAGSSVPVVPVDDEQGGVVGQGRAGHLQDGVGQRTSAAAK